VAEKGIFALRTAKDLFGKLEHDLVRVKKNPADSYAAFDFFVTAFHLKEWKYGWVVTATLEHREQLGIILSSQPCCV
jgi:hypothetical protein